MGLFAKEGFTRFTHVQNVGFLLRFWIGQFLAILLRFSWKKTVSVREDFLLKIGMDSVMALEIIILFWDLGGSTYVPTHTTVKYGTIRKQFLEAVEVGGLHYVQCTTVFI